VNDYWLKISQQEKQVFSPGNPLAIVEASIDLFFIGLANQFGKSLNVTGVDRCKMRKYRF
jgi:hypothetical protein